MSINLANYGAPPCTVYSKYTRMLCVYIYIDISIEFTQKMSANSRRGKEFGDSTCNILILESLTSKIPHHIHEISIEWWNKFIIFHIYIYIYSTYVYIYPLYQHISLVFTFYTTLIPLLPTLNNNTYRWECRYIIGIIIDITGIIRITGINRY